MSAVPSSMRFKHFCIQWICIFFLWGTFCNCVKVWDAPPLYTGPALKANMSIKDLLRLHIPNNYEKISADYIIEGTVTANDKTDNFYKSIIIQDSTAAVTIKLDGYNLFTKYAVGQKVGVALNGLWLSDYAGMTQIGIGVDRSDPASPFLLGIPQPLMSRYISLLAGGKLMTPIAVLATGLVDSLKGCLVAIDQLEFVVSDTGKPYSDLVNQLPTSHTLRTCSIGNLYLRTSGFASFGNALTPRGNGRATGIYTVFRTQKQLVIRDTSDLQLTGLRCSVTGPKILFSEDFSNALTDSTYKAAGYKNIAEIGGKYFTTKKTSGNNYLEISAFAARQNAVISWLILPPINLDHSANEILHFDTKDGFDNGAILQVMVSTNYDGGNSPARARWTLLPALMAKGSTSGFAPQWIFSNKLDLSKFKGSVYIAFRYEGNDPSAAMGKLTTSFRLDNIMVQGN
jgi:hypothetical protein